MRGLSCDSRAMMFVHRQIMYIYHASDRFMIKMFVQGYDHCARIERVARHTYTKLHTMLYGLAASKTTFTREHLKLRAAISNLDITKSLWNFLLRLNERLSTG